MWYHVEYARSGRSTCKEFRCKRKISEGELRIGIMQDENDHAGPSLGWYCFQDAQSPCLKKTFTYKRNANPPITAITSLIGAADLAANDQERLQVFIENLGLPETGPPTKKAKLVDSCEAAPDSLPSLSSEDTFLECPFTAKKQVKALGGRWNRDKTSWYVPAGNLLKPFAEWIRVKPAVDAKDVSGEAGCSSDRLTYEALSIPEACSKQVFLKSTFAEKEEVKSLGARWDREKSCWYVPSGLCLAPFTKWIGSDAVAPVMKVFTATQCDQVNSVSPPEDMPDSQRVNPLSYRVKKHALQSPDSTGNADQKSCSVTPDSAPPTLPQACSEPVFLRCAFALRAAVKALGARWDQEKASWYVLPGVALLQFASWIAPDAAAASMKSATELGSQSADVPKQTDGAAWMTKSSFALPKRTSEPVFLSCAFEEKESAKALGARWDGERSCWYVPPGKTLAPFSGWISPEALDHAVQMATAFKPQQVSSHPTEQSGISTGLPAETLTELDNEKRKLELLSASELKEMLRLNGQRMTGIKMDLVQRVAEGIVLGATPRCPSCFGGKPNFDRTKGLYTCPGYMDDDQFVRCQWSSHQLERTDWRT